MDAKGDTKPSAPDRPARGAKRALALLLAINLVNYIDRYVLVAVSPRIQEALIDHNDPNTQAKTGLLVTAFFISYMVFAPVFGWLADRVARWKLVAAAVIFWSLATGASGLATGFWMLLATRILVGIGEAVYGPAGPAMISDLYPVKSRGRALAWFYMAIPVGSAMGLWIGGLIAHHFGWREAFFAVVAPGILLGALCFFMKETPRGQSDAADANAALKLRPRDYLILLRTRSYVLNTIGMTALYFAIGGISAWMPIYVYRFRGVGDLASVNSIFGAITVVAGISATMLGGYVGDKLRQRHAGAYFIISGTSLLVSFPLVMATLYTPFPHAWGLIFLAVFCLFFNTGPSNTILANVTHPSMRASAYAINIFVIHALGDAISPPLIGLIADNYDLNFGFIAVSIMILIGAVFWLWGARYLANDTAMALHRLDGLPAHS